MPNTVTVRSENRTRNPLYLDRRLKQRKPGIPMVKRETDAYAFSPQIR
jgi:hypothetical protein